MPLHRTTLRNPNHLPSTHKKSTARILFLGTPCDFSGIVFSQLIQHSIRTSGSEGATVDICAVLLPARDHGAEPHALQRLTDTLARKSSVPHLQQQRWDKTFLGNYTDPNELPLFDMNRAPSISQLAQAQSIPVYGIGELTDPKVAAQIDLFAVDLICVACYPRRVPKTVLALPTYGFLNVHPSQLPHYRGPDPLFWIMRDGTQSTAGGVTIHWMDAQLDTGPIAAQQALQWPDGISAAAINQLCAKAGGQLLSSVLSDLFDHQFDRQPSPDAADAPSQPQPPNSGSYQSWPQPVDYALDLSWSAQHAFNFMRGTKTGPQTHFIYLDNERVPLENALAFDTETKMTSLFVKEGNEIHIQFSTGVLHASMTA